MFSSQYAELQNPYVILFSNKHINSEFLRVDISIIERCVECKKNAVKTLHYQMPPKRIAFYQTFFQILR